MSPPAARLEGVHERFGSVVALDGASLELRAGEVHGVLGENGAGKTTLLNVLAGMLTPDSGTVEIGGRSVRLRSPRHAWALGVGMVHQHFTLVPALTVLENLALGSRGSAAGLGLPYPRVRAAAAGVMTRTGLSVPLDVHVGGLGVGERQRVEILKTLLREPSLLVLDEPTAVLTPTEVHQLFDLLRALAEAGAAVVLVAHKLDEVLAVADRVTVLRRGRTVAHAPRADVDAAALVTWMVGEDAGRRRADVMPPVGARVGEEAGAPSGVGPPPGAEVVAELSGVRARGARSEWALADVSLGVRRGEIVGVAGVEGNGQRELARILAARARPAEGRVRIAPGVGFIPQDRTTEGLVADFDLTENVALALEPSLGVGWGMPWPELRARTLALMEEHDVRAPGPETRAGALSGGNQQRLVVARELAVASDLLVAENPTRGLDVAAAAFVHARIRGLTGQARPPGVVLISTDLDEVLELADRHFVMVRGRLRPVPAGARDRAGVGALMLAGGDEAA